MSSIGYTRVSTDKQNLDGQSDALAERGADRAFLEKVSGGATATPENAGLCAGGRYRDGGAVAGIERGTDLDQRFDRRGEKVRHEVWTFAGRVPPAMGCGVQHTTPK